MTEVIKHSGCDDCLWKKRGVIFDRVRIAWPPSSVEHHYRSCGLPRVEFIKLLENPLFLGVLIIYTKHTIRKHQAELGTQQAGQEEIIGHCPGRLVQG